MTYGKMLGTDCSLCFNSDQRPLDITSNDVNVFTSSVVEVST